MNRVRRDCTPLTIVTIFITIYDEEVDIDNILATWRIIFNMDFLVKVEVLATMIFELK